MTEDKIPKALETGGCRSTLKWKPEFAGVIETSEKAHHHWERVVARE